MLLKCGIVLSVLVCCSFAGQIKLPDHWPTCKRGPDMNKCLKNAIQIALLDLEKGNKTLGVLPLDPWKVQNWVFKRQIGPIDVAMTVNDIVLAGYKNIKMNEVKNDWKTLEMFFTLPELNINARYALNGSIFSMPVEGKGKVFLHFDDYMGHAKFYFDKIEKRDREYFKMTDAEFFPNARDCKVKFEGLFNGNEELANRIDDVVNKNWRVILRTVAPVISKSLGFYFKVLGDTLFTKIPADLIVPS